MKTGKRVNFRYHVKKKESYFDKDFMAPAFYVIAPLIYFLLYIFICEHGCQPLLSHSMMPLSAACKAALCSSMRLYWLSAEAPRQRVLASVFSGTALAPPAKPNRTEFTATQLFMVEDR